MTLTGNEFEKLIVFRAKELEESGLLTLTRYGVQAVMMNNRETGKPEWQIQKSLPDFDCCIKGGQQMVIEAKVCSQPSYRIRNNDQKHPKQIDHMLRRSRFGARCFFMIHFNPRELVKKSEPAETFAVPVDPDSNFWREYESCERTNINRMEADLYGIRVPWNLHSKRARNLSPDLTVLLPENLQPERNLI
jgi:penicillin-binding protein-related factor A (putative recombinase)